MRQLLTDLRGNPIHFSSRRRQRRYRHPNLPLLFYRVQNRAWDDVVRRARSHPHEVTIQEDATGNTPLHIACRLDPPSEVVRALLESSRTTNTEGATALHIAATHRCSADVIRVLLEDEDATSCLTRMGRAPIHYACMTHRGLGVEAFRLLLVETLQKGNVVMNESSVNEFDLIDEEDIAKEEEATRERQSNTVNVMTMRDCTGQTPLGLLFRRYRERVRKISRLSKNFVLNMKVLWHPLRLPLLFKLNLENSGKRLVSLSGDSQRNDCSVKNHGRRRIGDGAFSW
jgi:hypothetical protein